MRTLLREGHLRADWRLMVLVGAAVALAGVPCLHAQEASAEHSIMFRVDRMSIQSLLDLLQTQSGIPMVVGDAQDLTRIVLPSINLKDTPENILRAICRSGRVNCEYDADGRCWDVNSQRLVLPPVEGPPSPAAAATLASAAPAASFTIPSSMQTASSTFSGTDAASAPVFAATPPPASLAAAAYQAASRGSGGAFLASNTLAPSLGGVPVDRLDLSSAPPPKIVQAMIPVRYLDCRQLIDMITTGTPDSLSDPFLVVPFRHMDGIGSSFHGPTPAALAASSYAPAAAPGMSSAMYQPLSGDTGSPAQMYGGVAPAAAPYSGAVQPYAAGGYAPSSNSYSNSSPSVTGSQFQWRWVERSTDSFAQFPGGFGGGGANPGGFGGAGGQGGANGRGGAGGAGGAGGQQQQNPYGTLLPQGTKLLPYPLTNSIIAFTTDEGMDTLRTLIKLLDKRAPNILIKVTKLIVSDNNSKSAGLDYNLGTPLFSINTDTGARTSAGTVQINYLGSNLGATLNALESKSNSRVVATPRIILPDGVPGTISDTTMSFYTIPAVNPGGIVGGIPVQVQQGPQVGLTIPLLTRLNWDGTITVYSFISDSQSGAALTIPGGSGGPPSSIEQVSFPVPGIRVENGDTIVLGGFATHTNDSSVSQVPILGDLPLIGSLFRNTTSSNTQQEALYFITVNVVDVHGQSLPPGADSVIRELTRIDAGEEGNEGAPVAGAEAGAAGPGAPLGGGL